MNPLLKEFTPVKDEQVGFVSEKNDHSQITIRFETGTSQDDMIKYADTMRERLTGKVPEDQLENFISEYVSNIVNIVTICDYCKEEISDAEKAKTKVNFACRLCPLKYDLCTKCQEETCVTSCPDGFGCSDSNDYYAEEIPFGSGYALPTVFVPQEDREEIKTYTAFDKTFRVTEGTQLSLERESFIQDYEKSNHYLMSAIYITEKPVSHELLGDTWLYFRSTSYNSLEKYGKPNTILDSLGSYKVQYFYYQISECFQKFIDFDNDKNSVLMLRLVYPNGDEFIIKRLYGEEKLKVGFEFVTCFLPLSQYVTDSDQTSYNIESFRPMLEEKCGKTVEELNEVGQVLLVIVSIV
jgi:hypothetical protein